MLPQSEPFILDREAIKVLAVDTRLDILKLLDERPHTLTELATDLELAPATVSEHLGKLEDAGLIEKRDEGRKWKYYRLTAEGKRLFARKGGGLFLAFALTGLASVGLFATRFLSTSASPEAMSAPMADATEVMALRAEEGIASTPTALPPDWLLIAAIALGFASLIILGLFLAKRLRTEA